MYMHIADEAQCSATGTQFAIGFTFYPSQKAN